MNQGLKHETVLTVMSMIASLGLLDVALKALPVGTALLGIWLLGEPATVTRRACIALIVAGIVGLKFAG